MVLLTLLKAAIHNAELIETRPNLEEMSRDVRLVMYITQFPEMDRRSRKYIDDEAVQIRYYLWAPHCLNMPPSEFTTDNARRCTCRICTERRASPLWNMVLSKMARNANKALRDELFMDYLNLVDFEWDDKRSEENERTIETLSAFLALTQGFGTPDTGHPIKHLAISMRWNDKAQLRDVEIEEDHNMQKVGRIMGILHWYRVQAMICFPGTSYNRDLFLRRVAKICQEKLTRKEEKDWWVDPANTGNEGTCDLFTKDKELKQLAHDARTKDAVEESTMQYLKMVLGKVPDLKVKVDFAR